MKAIVLTHDRCHPIADHMIQSYQEIWPSHPFVFRVPYQVRPDWLKEKYAETIELVKTPQSIKQTLLALLADLDDCEWIYWCIDDKYLVAINEVTANHCTRWVEQIEDRNIEGLIFCRCRKLLGEKHLREGSQLNSPFGDAFMERKNCHQFGIPQFMCVGVLREVFNEFPDHEFRAKEMDNFTGQTPGLIVREFKPQQKMYVSMQNYVRFGESSTHGKITRNCYDSMISRGFEIPPHFVRARSSMFFGEFPEVSPHRTRDPLTDFMTL